LFLSIMTRLIARPARLPEPTLNLSSDNTTAAAALHGTIMGIMAMLSMAEPILEPESGTAAQIITAPATR